MIFENGSYKDRITIIALVAVIIIMVMIIILITNSKNTETDIEKNLDTNNYLTNNVEVTNDVNDNIRTSQNSISNITSTTSVSNTYTTDSVVKKPEIVVNNVEDTVITISIDGLNNITSGIKEIQYAIEKWDNGEPQTYITDKASPTSQKYTFKNLKPETIYTIYVQVFDNNNSLYKLKKENIETEKTK